MRFAVVSNTTDEVVREFNGPDDYVAPSHKFGLAHPERVVAIVQLGAPDLSEGQELRATQEISATELRRGWIAVSAPPPASVSRRQFRGALRRVGLFTQVDSLRHVPDLDEITRGDLIDFLDAANTIERDHPMVAQFAPMLGVTSEQIDDVFRLAATL